MYSNLEFYIPCFIDFRGRIYSYVPYLNYQGSDLARGLLLFSNKGVVNNNNMKYLYYYCANVYGLSNKIYEKRLEWGEKNIPNYIKSILDRDNKNEFNKFIKEISNVKEPIQFLASLLSIDKAHKTGYSRQPILFDATCSGLQHLAGICGDLTLAKYVNVIGDNKIRFDMYEEASKYIITEISNLDPSEKKELENIIITRSSVKKAIMTIPYGISVSSLNEDLQEVFEAEKIFENKKLYISIPGKYLKDGETKLISGRNWGLLVNMIYRVLYSMHPVVKDFTDYLKNMSKLLLELNRPVI
jgi:DNA-directed RNA polymerase